MAFCRLEEIADVPDLLPEGIDGPDGSCAEMGFKLCEGHFDRIEVKGYRVAGTGSMHPGLDGFLGGLALVGRQIVQDDDIAFVEGWCELLLDIGLEDAPVHRGLDDEGGGELVAAQAGDEGLGHPMPERRLAAEPLALQAVATQTGQTI